MLPLFRSLALLHRTVFYRFEEIYFQVSPRGFKLPHKLLVLFRFLYASFSPSFFFFLCSFLLTFFKRSITPIEYKMSCMKKKTKQTKESHLNKDKDVFGRAEIQNNGKNYTRICNAVFSLLNGLGKTQRHR